MHLVETYALNCGAKIGKPFIYTSFFPIPFEKYISFHTDCVGNARNYDYWQDVINILNPILQQHNIHIIQVGGAKDREYSDCISVKGQTSINQLAYVIKNSMLHFGPDSLAIHLAGGFDIPLVALYSTNFVECVKPYFGSKEKQIFISTYDKMNLKPSFSNEENPKTINSVKPEEIAKAILKLIGLESFFEIPFESIFFGKKYSGFSIQESIPNCNEMPFNPDLLVEFRTDKFYDENLLGSQLARCKQAIIFMDKPINIDLLKHFKKNIAMLVFDVNKAEDRDFIRQLEATGMKITLVSHLSQEELEKLKIHFYELGNINRIEPVSDDKINELKKDIDNLYYRSAKITSSNGKFYYSLAAAEKDIPMKNHFEYQKVIDSPSFWQNLDFFTIVKLKEKSLT